MIINMPGSYFPKTTYTKRSVFKSWEGVSKLSTIRTVNCDGFVPYAIYGHTYHSNHKHDTVHGCIKNGTTTPQSPLGWGCNQKNLVVETAKEGYTFNAHSVSFQPYKVSSHGGKVYARVFGKEENT